jgi:hypothetical protein
MFLGIISLRQPRAEGQAKVQGILTPEWPVESEPNINEPYRNDKNL